MIKYICVAVLLAIQGYATILQHDNLIDQRAIGKINEITNEVEKTTNTKIYIHISNDNGLDDTNGVENMITQIKQQEQDTIATFDGSFVILFLAVEQKYINIIYSDDMTGIIDKDDIIDGYMVPLLASYDKNKRLAKVSASVLNGVAQIGDEIADAKNIELKSSIGSVGKTTGTIWTMFVYTLVLFSIVAYFFIILRERKIKKGLM